MSENLETNSLNKTKTWGRELSVVLILILGYLAYSDKMEALGLLVWPFMLFVMQAFGFKQEAITNFLGKK